MTKKSTSLLVEEVVQVNAGQQEQLVVDEQQEVQLVEEQQAHQGSNSFEESPIVLCWQLSSKDR